MLLGSSSLMHTPFISPFFFKHLSTCHSSWLCHLLTSSYASLLVEGTKCSPYQLTARVTWPLMDKQITTFLRADLFQSVPSTQSCCLQVSRRKCHKKNYFCQIPDISRDYSRARFPFHSHVQECFSTHVLYTWYCGLSAKQSVRWIHTHCIQQNQSQNYR